MKKSKMAKLNADELKKELHGLRKELFDLKLNLSGGEVKDYSQFKKRRADMARCLTFLQQKKIEEKITNKTL